LRIISILSALADDKRDKMIGDKQSKLEEHFEEVLKTPVPNMLLLCFVFLVAWQFNFVLFDDKK
jgi:hypothetical protein